MQDFSKYGQRSAGRGQDTFASWALKHADFLAKILMTDGDGNFIDFLDESYGMPRHDFLDSIQRMLLAQKVPSTRQLEVAQSTFEIWESQWKRLSTTPDPNALPRNYDEDVWELTLFWQEKRDQYNHPGPGKHLVYANLLEIFATSGIRDKENWTDLAHEMIDWFWDNEEIACVHPLGALDEFCRKGYFVEDMNWRIDKARRKAIMDEHRREREANPKPIVRQRRYRPWDAK